MWEFWKKKGGGVYPNPTSIFTVFNMGDPPTINVPKVRNCKINHNFFSSQKHDIPKQKFPHFSVVFFLPTSLKAMSQENWWIRRRPYEPSWLSGAFWWQVDWEQVDPLAGAGFKNVFFYRFQDYMMANLCHKINRLCNPLVPFRFFQVSTFKCLLPKEDNYKPNDIVLSGRKKERRYL